MMLSKIRQTKLGKFIFAVGCLFPVGVILLFVADEIDDQWIAKWTSLSFEKKESSFDMTSFFSEAVIADENTITLFGCKNRFASVDNKPMMLQTTDGGRSWKRTEIDIDIHSASFDRFRDSIYMVSYFFKNDSVDRLVYVSSGDLKKWEFYGAAKSGGIGLLFVDKDSPSFRKKSFVIERENIPYVKLGNLCNGIERYAQNDKDWIACGFDDYSFQTHEIRILHRIADVFKIHTSITNKWHLIKLKYTEVSDFYVKNNLLVGIFVFKLSSRDRIHYLYYSVDGGKTWENKKIPVFDRERLAVTENKIVILGLNFSYKKRRGEATILTIPLPKN